MILLGAWMALIGYGILYAGVGKLGGSTCGLKQAFTRDGCKPGTSVTGASVTVAQPGVTLAAQQQAQAQQQAVLIPGQVLV